MITAEKVLSNRKKAENKQAKYLKKYYLKSFKRLIKDTNSEIKAKQWNSNIPCITMYSPYWHVITAAYAYYKSKGFVVKQKEGHYVGIYFNPVDKN